MVSRADHRRGTLLRLSDAAVHCFEAHGMRATVEQIALEAGVSRRTVFRYVAAKEELVFVHPLLWLDVWDAARDTVPHAPLETRLLTAGRAVAAYIDDDPEPPRRSMLLALRHPEMASGFHHVFQRWIDRVASEALDDAVAPVGRMHARVIGSAVMGAVDAALREWLLTEPTPCFGDLFERAFEMVVPLLKLRPTSVP